MNWWNIVCCWNRVARVVACWCNWRQCHCRCNILFFQFWKARHQDQTTSEFNRPFCSWSQLSVLDVLLLVKSWGLIAAPPWWWWCSWAKWPSVCWRCAALDGDPFLRVTFALSAAATLWDRIRQVQFLPLIHFSVLTCKCLTHNHLQVFQFPNCLLHFSVSFGCNFSNNCVAGNSNIVENF